MAFTKDQLAARKELLTATDVAAICGVSKYKTPHDVFATKVLGADEPKMSWRMQRGTHMESLLLDWFAQQNADLEVEKSGTITRRHATLPWFAASPDGIVRHAEPGLRVHLAPIAVVEAKTSGQLDGWFNEAGDESIPDDYAIQVQVQLSVVAVKRAYVVADLPGQDEPRIMVVQHDPELEEAIITKCTKFRDDYLLPKVPPPFSDPPTYDEVRTIFRRPKSRNFTLWSEEADFLAQSYMRARVAEKEAAEEKERAKASLCALIGDHEGIAGSNWRATWVEREETVVPSYVRKAYRHFDLRERGKGKR